MNKANGTKNGLEKYRRLLLRKRSELQSTLRGKLETLAAPGRAAPEDLAPVYHDQFVALKLNHLDATVLRMIDAALERMDGGEYGMCEECGEAVSGRRLEAIPWAVRCIVCEERQSAVEESKQWAELVA